MRYEIPESGMQSARNRKEVEILSHYLRERHADTRWDTFVRSLVRVFDAGTFLNWFVNLQPTVAGNFLVLECPRAQVADLIVKYCERELTHLAKVAGFNEIEIVSPVRLPA